MSDRAYDAEADVSRDVAQVVTDCWLLVLDAARFANLMAKLVDHDLCVDFAVGTWAACPAGSCHNDATATHMTCTNTRGAPFAETPMCPEGVAWAATSYTCLSNRTLDLMEVPPRSWKAFWEVPGKMLERKGKSFLALQVVGLRCVASVVVLSV